MAIYIHPNLNPDVINNYYTQSHIVYFIKEIYCVGVFFISIFEHESCRAQRYFFKYIIGKKMVYRIMKFFFQHNDGGMKYLWEKIVI
jgi:hypothetical protein